MSTPATTWEALCNNAQKFHLNTERFACLESFFQSLDKEKFSHYASQLPIALEERRDVERMFSASGDLERFLLLCAVANYDHTVEYYTQNNLPESMQQEIVQDMGLWTRSLIRDLGGDGLTWRIYDWEIDCITGIVKPFGRLQCNDIHQLCVKWSFYRQPDGSVITLPALQKTNPPNPDLTYGDSVINFHIPASGPLTTSECIASYKRMLRFTQEQYPDRNIRAIVSYSWIFDPIFQKLLSESSNIVRLQGLGHMAPMTDHDETNEVIWRIWGNAGLNTPYSALPRTTSMERNVAQYLQNGGKFQEGLFVIFPDELDRLP